MMDFAALLKEHERWERSSCKSGKQLIVSKMTIAKEPFIDRIMSSAMFDKCCFRECRFERTDLYAAYFAGSTFERCSFVDCNLNKSNFDCTILVDTELIRCQLIKSTFFKADARGISLAECDVRGTDIPDL